MQKTNTRLGLVAVSIAALLSIGTLVYSSMEGWDLVDSFYFTSMTLTTIGYGDLYPTNAASKLFTSFFAFTGIGVMVYSLAAITEHLFERRMRMHLPKPLEELSRPIEELKMVLERHREKRNRIERI